MQSIFPPSGRRVRRIQRLAIKAGWIVLTCASLTSPAYSQASIKPHVRYPVIRTDVHQVLIPTTVTDSHGHPVQGLRKQDFRLLEDGVERPLANFFVADGPISIGIILDISGSVRNKVAEARQAVSEFLRLSSPKDEFSSSPSRMSPNWCGRSLPMLRTSKAIFRRFSPWAGLRCTMRW